jgi:hypothetical protein
MQLLPSGAYSAPTNTPSDSAADANPTNPRTVSEADTSPANACADSDHVTHYYCSASNDHYRADGSHHTTLNHARASAATASIGESR